MNLKIRNGLYFLLAAVLFLPMVQHFFPFIKSGPLYGFSGNAPDVEFTFEKWWDGSFQEQKTRHLNDDLGLRPDIIRLTNQLDYSLFGLLHSWKVVEGKEHYLYMDTYINGYFGRDYMGYDSILKKMMKVKALNDTLARLGKSLILVHSPAKEFMYPEYIPDNFRQPPPTTTNIATYRRITDSLHITQVDFNAWFCALRHNCSEVLYPKQGVHWSVYGAFLAADSLIRCIEQVRHIAMPHPVITKVERTTNPRYSDDDIAKTLNLIYPITRETLSYPEIVYTHPQGMVKPRVIYVGDSFLPIWINAGIMDETNTDWQVWQWFSQYWDKDSREGKKAVLETPWINALEHTDCLVIMYTSFNLPVLGNGFIEQAYDHYFPRK